MAFIDTSSLQTQRLIALIVLVFTLSNAARSDEPTKLTLYPAAEAQPALKYRLLPEFMDRKPGNAAVYYGKVTAERMGYFGNGELRDKVDRWSETPLVELLEEEVRMPIDTYMLKQAALCTTCDWQLPLHEGRYFELPLPGLQQTREFSRILNATARIQIAHKEFEEAIETFQIGFALGRNVAEGETIVNGLTGIAIARHILEQVEEFVQQPEAPNLYWAVTMLPNPLADLREGINVELNIFELSFPEAKDWDARVRSPEEWREVLYAYCELAAVAEDGENKLGRADELYLEMLESYPDAKRALIERGMEVDDIDAMSRDQVVAFHTLQTLRRQQQAIYKYFHLPFPEAIKGISASIERAGEYEATSTLLLDRLGSAARSVRTAVARNNRRFAALRVIEALRIYGASHDGKLPTQLNEITEVPIPLDPIAGKPFEYELEGETATLRGPTVRDTPLYYEITMLQK